MFNLRSIVTALCVGCAAPLLLVGCGSAEGGQAREGTGALRAALSTVGADGATYQLPPGTFLFINGEAIGGSNAFPIDGSQSLFELSLPVGSYSLSLSFANGSPPTLLRSKDGVTTQVPAAEDDPSPIDFTIAQDVASQVALHFHTSALSDVTFTTGKLELSFEVVQQVTVESSVTEATGDLAVDAELYADPSADYAAALDVASTESLAVSLRSLSDWSFATATAICKSASVTSFGFSSPGLERRLAEVASDSARVCIFDDGDNDVVQIAMQRNGSAPVEQQSFLPNADYSFVMDLLMPVGDVFDGATLKQSALAGPVTVVGGNFDNAIFEAGTELAFANGALSGSVQLLP